MNKSDYELLITGTERDVANSAWISTLDEIAAKGRTQEDVERVVKFLVENHHSSPFEAVSVTFRVKKPFVSSDSLRDYKEYWGDLYSFLNLPDKMEMSFARVSYLENESILTVDLLNFIKTIRNNNLFHTNIWTSFSEKLPKLAELIRNFPVLEKSETVNAAEILGNHGMVVQLINIHSVGHEAHDRVTWRVKTPLSIAVQMLRHRAASYNMVSGRYRTINQEMIDPVQDCSCLLEKAGIDIELYLKHSSSVATEEYSSVMKKIKSAKDKKTITNDEYKRLREYVRFVLPEGRMTELYVTSYVSDFYNNYLKLRDSKHAQTEHIWVAQEMQRTLEQVYKRRS